MEEYRQKKPQPGPHGAEAGALQHKIESSVCKSVQSKVDNILKDVEKLTDVEKLYLYLKLPSGPNNGSDKCDQSSLTSSRTQQTYAFSWIQNHLEEHPDTSLPKQEVYDEYKSYCDNLGYHPLSAADFGKIMKNVFPNMKARRLGMRGKSKYCYSGLRKKAFVHLPSLPNLDVHKMSDGCEVQESSGTPSNSEDEVRLAACSLVCEWAQKVLSRPFDCVENLARYLLNSQYIGTKSVAALTVMTGMSTGTKTVVQPSAFVPTDEARTFQPQVKTLPSPTIDAKQQLQRKIQKKQQEQKLQSPLPCEAQARRMEVGTHCTGPSIPSGSPALLSPQPTIGIVVAAVPSPITVPRSRQLTSPSPVATAENKVLPVNFQVVSQPIQSVKQTPKTPQSVSGSPVCERLASRPRYPQILPKPSATGALTLRSPQTLLITNSPIKTVVPTPHVAPINVVKMTAISLSATGNTSTAALRPILTGVTGSGLAEDQRQAPQVQRGSAGNRQSPLQSPVPTKSVCMATTSAVDVKMEAIANNQALAADQLNASQEVFGDQKGERGAKPRAASEPAPCTKGAPGTDGTAKSKCGEKSPVNSSTVAASAGSNNNKNNGERALYLTVSSQNTSITLSSHPMYTTTPPKESSLAPRSLRKRPGAGLESIPVKKVFIAHQPVSSAESTVAELKKVPQLVTLARPESAPATTTCKVTVKLNSTVPTRILACSDSPLGNPSTFQTAANLQASPQLKGDEPSAQSDGSELAYGAIPTTSSQALLKDMGSSSLAMQSNLIDTSILDDLKNSIWEEGQLGSLQQQAFVGQMLDHKSVSTPVIDQLPMEPQGPPSNELTLQSGVDFTGSQPSVDYFPFNDDDMTQDSIVEELVQMEEQMKLNSLHSYSGRAEVALQSQSMVGQGTILSTHQMGTPFYQSLHSSTTPTLTPTPTPTPTSEMMGVGAGLTRESPCSQLAPTTPVDGSFGSNHHTPIGTPHSNCSTSVPPSPVDSCRNPFAFTPINSSITGYHNASIVSSSPLKPMQRPTATHPNKAKLEWMNSEYNSDSGTSAISNNGISIFPSYQNSVEDQFRKPHAFAIPGQSHQSQSRHDSNFRHLIPVSPVPQHTTAVIGQGKEEGFAVPAPLDNKIPCSSSGGTFRCRSVSPAVRQRNLSGSTIHSSATVCPFNSPATPEVLHIFASSCSDVDSSNMAQRSQSVPLNVMMQTEMLPMQTTTNSTKITSVLLSKMDPDGDDAVRGLGVNNMPSNYTARMNLTQILETTSTFRGGAGRQTPTNEYANRNPSQFQKPSYLTKMARNEQMILSSRDTQAQMSPREQQPELQQETQLEPTCANQQPVDFDSTVKDLLGDDSLNPSSNLVGHVASELSSVASDFSSDLRFTSELPSSINDLDTNLLFDSSHQQEQYDDSTLDELKNDPLFQQICTENSATFDWLESKDQHTVEMLG